MTVEDICQTLRSGLDPNGDTADKIERLLRSGERMVLYSHIPGVAFMLAVAEWREILREEECST